MHYFSHLTSICDNRLKLATHGTISPTSKLETQPPSISQKLKIHQLSLLSKMLSLENTAITPTVQVQKSYKYRLGVVGDRVGSGKSLVLLSLIAKKPYFENVALPIKNALHLINIHQKYKECDYIKTNLIIVPHNIVKQWEGYIRTHTNLNYYVISRKSHCKKEVSDYNNIPLVLISSSQYNYFADKYTTNHIFSRIFYDEADSLNIPNNREIPAFFYWFITSSIKNLLFPSGYYYTQHEDCSITCSNNCQGFTKFQTTGIKNTGFIKNTFLVLEKTLNLEYYLKNSRQSIDNSFTIPEPIKSIIHCKMDTLCTIIEDVIDKDLLDRINAGDVVGAIHKLNMVHNTEHNIIQLVSKKIVTSIDNYQKKKDYLLSLNIASEKERNLKIQKIQQKIGSFYSRLSHIKEKITNYTSELCPICLDTLQKPIGVTNCCQNMFCFNCLAKSLCMTNQKCPLCRNFILSTQDFHLLEDTKKEREGVSKITALANLLVQKSKKAKILIFSAYNSTFTHIQDLILEQGLTYSKISGNMGNIQNILEKFKKGDINVLLLNSKNYGTGMNIPEATDLIIYHKMDQEMETQVIGRAQRIGRKSQLKVYYLYHSNELETPSLLPLCISTKNSNKT